MEAPPILIEKLTAVVNQLPPHQVQEVLDFASYLLTRQANGDELSLEQQRALELIGLFSGPENLAERHDDYLSQDDAALQLIGLFDSGIDDLAENHDKHLATFYSKDNDA